MILDYSKQMNLIEPYKDCNKRINIIGCGAGGSWLTFFLLKMGFNNIHVYDFDEIEEHNIPNQCFSERHIGVPKTHAMLDVYDYFTKDEFEPRLKIHNQKITEDNAHMLSGIVISCVDTMKDRKMLYEMCYKYGQAELWIEGRLSIYGAYIYTLSKDGKDYTAEYEKSFYEDEEAEVSACGVSQTALPSAVNQVSIEIMQMIAWLKGEPFHNKIQYAIPDMIVFTE